MNIFYLEKIPKSYIRPEKFQMCIDQLYPYGIIPFRFSAIYGWDLDLETIWVIEDDIQVIINPLVISNLIEELDETVGKDNWNILCTDRDIRNSKGGRHSSLWLCTSSEF